MEAYKDLIPIYTLLYYNKYFNALINSKNKELSIDLINNKYIEIYVNNSYFMDLRPEYYTIKTSHISQETKWLKDIENEEVLISEIIELIFQRIESEKVVNPFDFEDEDEDKHEDDEDEEYKEDDDEDNKEINKIIQDMLEYQRNVTNK